MEYTVQAQILFLLYREHYFLDLKNQIRRGDTHIPNNKMAIIGAHIAQAEMGDLHNSSTNVMVYPPYFPSWNSGISHLIRKEHARLQGKHVCTLICTQFVMCACEPKNYFFTLD